MESKRKTIIISAFFGIVTLFLVAFVFILLNGIDKSAQELKTIKEDLVSVEKKRENLDKIKEKYSQWGPDLDKIDNLFVNSDEPLDLIKFWEETAESSGLLIDISSISSQIIETDSLSRSLNFQVSLSGSFPNFSKFLNKIENSPYLTEIRNVSIARTEEKVNINLAVKVYAK